MLLVVFFFQAEDGIRDLVRSRGLGDVYKRQVAKQYQRNREQWTRRPDEMPVWGTQASRFNDDGVTALYQGCLLYTSDAADERSSVDLGGRRIIKKKKNEDRVGRQMASK